MNPKYLLFVFFIGTCLLSFKFNPLHAQAIMTADINTSGNSTPYALAEYDGKLYFRANDGISGNELWVYDGITTSQVADLTPGAGSTLLANLIVYNGKLYFTVSTEISFGTYDLKLWEFNGTNFSMIGDLDDSPTMFFTFNPDFEVYDGKLYFTASIGSTGRELYSYDGTSITLAANINNSSSAHSDPFYKTVYDGKLYFRADDGTDGIELWVYDGTSASQVADINSGSGDSSPNDLTVYDNKLYFDATDNTYGSELRAYDGTNVTLVNDIQTGTASGTPNQLIVYNGALFFNADDGTTGRELWKFDGTNASLVADIHSSGSSLPLNLTTYNGKLYFQANDGIDGKELWQYDGTSASQVADINSGASNSTPNYLTQFNGKLYFSANDGINGTELWELATLSIPTSPGTYTSTQSLTDGEWTHYVDANSKLLLSLKIGTSGAVIPDNGVSLKIESPTTEYFAQDCGSVPPCFIDLQDGAVSFKRNWDVAPTTQPNNGNVGVKYYFTQAEYDAINTEISNQGQDTLTGMEQMWFYKVTNTALGQFPDIENITANDVVTLGNHTTTPALDQWVLNTKVIGSEFISEFEVSSFSGGGGGGAGSGAQPLPVELVYFHAYAHADVVKLQWATASETNNLGFEIQKSRDGLDWEKIAFVEGKRNTDVLSEYDFTDKNPYIGENYYRLKQIGLDGKYEYLPIQVVNLESGDNATVSIFPNPAKDFLNITNIQGQATIYDISGKLLKTFQLTEDGVNAIDINDLQNGVYHLVLLRDTGEQISKRFLK